MVNYEKTNRPDSALVLINLSEVGDEATHVPKRAVLIHLRKLNAIEEIIEVQAADFDVIIKVRFESLKELSEFVDGLRSIQGIEEASSAIITDESVMPPPILS